MNSSSIYNEIVTVVCLLCSQYFHVMVAATTRAMLATAAMIRTVITDILVTVTSSYGHVIEWRARVRQFNSS